MSTPNPSLEEILQRLRHLRELLLQLHKALLEFEEVEYEKTHGRIQSKGELFQLVIGHDWFSWLRPISQYIVQIDEAMSPRHTITLEGATGLLTQGRSLLHSLQSTPPSDERYDHAIQHNPDVAFMHAQLTQLLTVDS